MPKLTPYKVDNLRPRGVQFEVFDEGRPLAIRIGTTGTKSWVMFYRTGAGRQRRMTLGRYPALSIADARRLCETHLAAVQSGIDPADQRASERAQRRQAATFADLASNFIERHAKRHKRSWYTDQRYLERFLLPAFGASRAADIGRRDVIALVETIAKETPIQARRAFALARAIYNWGIRVDLVEVSPCDRVRAPGREQARDRVLTDGEIGDLWKVLEGARNGTAPMTEATALAIRLALVTGQRIGEIVGLSWFEIDRASGWWTIPAARSKNGLEHRVPLSRLALGVLARAAEVGGGSGFMFPGRDPARHIDHNVIGHALRRAREQSGLAPFTAHDLRRTAATRMASAGVPRVVVGKILNHAERGVTAIYDRASYDQEKREALDLWAGELLRLVGQQGQATGGQP